MKRKKLFLNRKKNSTGKNFFPTGKNFITGKNWNWKKAFFFGTGKKI